MVGRKRKLILNAKQLRSFNRDSSSVNEKRITKNEIYIVLDTYNNGSIFR